MQWRGQDILLLPASPRLSANVVSEPKAAETLMSPEHPGDYWLVTATMGGKVIPAGTKIISFHHQYGTACSTRWMTEYKSGEEWLPTAPVQDFAETAVKALSGQDVEYSAVVKYNFAATFLNPSKQWSIYSG